MLGSCSVVNTGLFGTPAGNGPNPRNDSMMSQVKGTAAMSHDQFSNLMNLKMRRLSTFKNIGEGFSFGAARPLKEES